MTERTFKQTTSNARPGEPSRPGTLPALPGFPAVERMLDMERRLYEELDELSRGQGELIEQERTDDLLALLGRRQTLLTKIQAVNDSIAPVRARWQEFLSPLEPQQRQRVGSLVDSITKLIEGVAERDRADRQRMQESRDRVASELAGLESSRRAAGAYGVGMNNPRPLFQDREA